VFEVTIICSDCGEDSREVVERVDDVDRAACPCGYSYVARSVAAYEPIYSTSRSLLTSKGGTVQLDGSIEWHDAQGRLHRTNGPARVFSNGRREWFRHGYLHRKGGPAVIELDGRRIWFQEGEKIREEAGSAKEMARR
jgi:hypothetical protein